MPLDIEKNNMLKSRNLVLKSFCLYQNNPFDIEVIGFLNSSQELLKNHKELFERVECIKSSLSIKQKPLKTSWNLLLEKIDDKIKTMNFNLSSKPIYVITPTGDRQEALNLSIKMMNNQTIKPDMWIIVDDGKNKSNFSNINCNHVIINCEPMNEMSVLRNIREAISNVPSTNCKVIIWEDDDYYPPKYLEHVSKMLDCNNFVTVQNLWYYHVGLRKYYNMFLNDDNSSLHSFAMTGNCLKYFSEYIENSDKKQLFLDLNFIKYIKEKEEIVRGYNNDHYPIHITGMNCKRLGFTQSHQTLKIANDKNYINDHHCFKLRELVGEDFYKNYLKFYIRNKGNVYIISNVYYPEKNKLNINKDDLLVFINKSISADYYKQHENKMQIKRFQDGDYGLDRDDMETLYALGKNAHIPKSFVKKLDENYDWNYESENENTKGCTTGYLVANYIQSMFPNNKIYLVNFGFQVKNSTYRCPLHNWKFEDLQLQKFEHINLEEK